jgi:P27 family predicted phage terminase small subunit
MPSHLTGMARICWTWTTKQLAAMGVLSQADRQTLERYCMLYARWREVETFLKKEGHTYAKTDKAGLVTGFGMHPEVRIAHALVDQLLRLEAQFGLTPSSRTRLVASREPTPAAPQGKQRFFRKGLEVVK